MERITKVLDEIVVSLSNESAPVTDSLLKTKVLLHKLGHAELVDWVNNELNGYSDTAELPPYRHLKGTILANVSNGFYRHTSHPLPLMHLTDSQMENLTTSWASQSVAVIEGMLTSTANKPARLHADPPMEANGLLGKSLERTYRVERAWLAIDYSALKGVLIQVRSRLLDFILGLRGQLPEDLTYRQVKTQTEGMDMPGMFKHAIFGDNTTILVGHQNTQTVKNSKSVQGDFQSLASELRQHHVSEPDIIALKEALSRDEASVEVSSKRFGPAVKGWMKSMFDKAMDASWNVELGIVSGLLTTVLQKYILGGHSLRLSPPTYDW
jgi:hypothetical protein